MGLYRDQLIDLESDPGEMVNLAVEQRYDGRRPRTGWKMEVKEHLLSGWMCCVDKHISQEEVFDGTVRQEGEEVKA
jgi:hypothetical protein